MPRNEREIDTDRLEALERRATLHQPASSGDLPAVDVLAEVRAELRQIRDTQVEIKLQLARGEARFQAVEDWQRRHDEMHAEKKADVKALFMPVLGQILWLGAAGFIGYLAANLKHN